MDLLVHRRKFLDLGRFLPKVAVWLPITNATSFGSGQDVESIDGNVFGEEFELLRHHGYLTAGLYLAPGPPCSSFSLVRGFATAISIKPLATPHQW
ncbi:MAG: hypothetical protein R2706_20245 [Acidimicrobiales bacterium]